MSQKYILKLSNLTDFLLDKISKKPNFIIAIDGRGGSGKSTLGKELSTKLPNSKLVQLDGILGDGELYTKENIEQGFKIDFSENRSSSEMIKAISNYKTPVLIIEGCFSFKIPINFNFRIWVECDKSICYQRLVNRERADRLDIATELIILANTKYQECEDKYIKNYQPQEKANIIYNIYKTKCT